IMRVGAVEVVGKADLLIRAGRIHAPDLLAGLDVVGGRVAAHAKLGARGANESKVLDDVGRLGQRLADLDVAVLDLPELLARLGVESDEVAVKVRLDDESRRLAGARPVGQSAVDEVAAGDRAGRRILLRLVLPNDAARIVQI